MKKLMIALTAVAMAAGVQAASYNWSGSDSCAGFAEGYEDQIAPGTAYFFIDGVNDAVYADIAAAVADGKAASILKFALDTAAVTADMGAFQNVFPATGADVYPDYEGSDAFVVIINDGTVTEYMTGEELTKMGKSYAYISDPLAIPEQDALGGAAVEFGSLYDATSSAGAWTTQSVPEPTSGLLLLLGVAGLALRRRRA